jgi:hypothetical protein
VVVVAEAKKGLVLLTKQISFEKKFSQDSSYAILVQKYKQVLF